MGVGRWGPLGAVLLAGCFAPSREGAARLAAEEREAGEFDAAIDKVEGRLLENQARVHLWSDLADRHQSVSALACTNAGFHKQQMVAIADRQAAWARAMKAGKVALAPQKNVGGPKVSPVSARPAPKRR